MKIQLGIVAIALVALAGPARSDVVTVTPAEAVVLPAGQGNQSRVALRFDLSGIPAGEGRVIDEASFNWVPSVLSVETDISIEARVVTSAWSASQNPGALGSMTIDEAPADFCDLSPSDVERTGEALIRFDLSGVVGQWLSGQEDNNGIVVVLPALDAQALANHLSSATLTIRYGFRN